MSKIMIVGDVHLGKGLAMGRPAIGTALNSRIIDQSKLLDWIFDQAMDNNVTTLILTGDICEDAKPDYVVLHIFFDFLRQCQIHNLDVHIVAGNHDIKRTGNHYISVLDAITSLDLDYVHIHKQIKTIYKEGVCITLLPFRDRRSFNCESNFTALQILENKLPFELADIPPSYDRVLVGHLALEGSLWVGDEIDDYANELICPLTMFAGYDYVWMGHIHKPQVRSQQPYIAHIGSLDLSDFGETDHQKIVVIYDSDSSPKFQEILVPSRPLRKVDLTVPNNTDSTLYVLEQLTVMHQAKPLTNAIVKLDIKLSGLENCNLDRSQIEQWLAQRGVYHICSFSESRKLHVTPVAQQSIIDNTIDPKLAIKLYAEQFKFASEEAKNKYIEMSLETIDTYQTSLRK